MDKRLIELYFPVEEAKRAVVIERHSTASHPSLMHHWWGTKPHGLTRCLIFSALARADGENIDELKRIATQLCYWREGRKDAIISAARKHMDTDVVIVDPYCGSGTTLVEAQALGLPAIGCEISPLGALISMCKTELLFRWREHPPAHKLGSLLQISKWGLLDDIRLYGHEVLRRVQPEIERLYPQPPGHNAVAYIWVRSVECPGCGRELPLIKQPVLLKGGKAYLGIRWDGEPKFYVSDKPAAGINVSRRGVKCIWCGRRTRLDYVKEQAVLRRWKSRLAAIIVHDRYYKAIEVPEGFPEMPEVEPKWFPEEPLPYDETSRMAVGQYGILRVGDTMTTRQLETIRILASSIASLKIDGDPEYADAVKAYLAIALSKACYTWNTTAFMYTNVSNKIHKLSSPYIPIRWQYVEVNPIGRHSGSWMNMVRTVVKGLSTLSPRAPAKVIVGPAENLVPPPNAVVITDPPYGATVNYGMMDNFGVAGLKLLASMLPESSIVASIVRDASKASPKESPAETLSRLSRKHLTAIFYGIRKPRLTNLTKTPELVETDWLEFYEELIEKGQRPTMVWLAYSLHYGSTKPEGAYRSDYTHLIVFNGGSNSWTPELVAKMREQALAAIRNGDQAGPLLLIAAELCHPSSPGKRLRDVVAESLVRIRGGGETLAGQPDLSEQPSEAPQPFAIHQA